MKESMGFQGLAGDDNPKAATTLSFKSIHVEAMNWAGPMPPPYPMDCGQDTAVVL
jgi:hypothetical protein